MCLAARVLDSAARGLEVLVRPEYHSLRDCIIIAFFLEDRRRALLLDIACHGLRGCGADGEDGSQIYSPVFVRIPVKQRKEKKGRPSQRTHVPYIPCRKTMYEPPHPSHNGGGVALVEIHKPRLIPYHTTSCPIDHEHYYHMTPNDSSKKAKTFLFPIFCLDGSKLPSSVQCVQHVPQPPLPQCEQNKKKHRPLRIPAVIPGSLEASTSQHRTTEREGRRPNNAHAPAPTYTCICTHRQRGQRARAREGE